MKENLKKQYRTKKKLMDSMIELCNKKGYYNLTIEEICQNAGTYRSTFYRYFNSKDDLLREIEKKYVQDTRDLTPSILACSDDDFEILQEKFLDELIQDMKYHYAHKQLCIFLLSPIGDPFFSKRMKESLTQIYEDNLCKNGILSPSSQTYIINFFVNGYISTVYQWLKNDDCSPEEIARFLLKMIHTFLVAYHLPPHTGNTC